MSTRSRIAVKLDDNNIKSVYCHSDGYPSHVGNMLLNHHNSKHAALKIIVLGDLSSLHESLDKPKGHSFDNRIKGYTVAYGRDRGETGIEARDHHNMNNLIKTANDSDAVYIYLFDCTENKWFYLQTNQAINNIRKGIHTKPLVWYELNEENTTEKGS